MEASEVPTKNSRFLWNDAFVKFPVLTSTKSSTITYFAWLKFCWTSSAHTTATPSCLRRAKTEVFPFGFAYTERSRIMRTWICFRWASIRASISLSSDRRYTLRLIFRFAECILSIRMSPVRSSGAIQMEWGNEDHISFSMETRCCFCQFFDVSYFS